MHGNFWDIKNPFIPPWARPWSALGLGLWICRPEVFRPNGLSPKRLVTDVNQAQGEHKHSLTFRVRRYVVIATKPVHRLQIRQ